MRKFALAIALIHLSARAVSGQTDEGLRVVALPEGRPIFCRVPDTDSAHPLPPKAVAREFRFGPPNETRILWSREIHVAFDSTGRALVLLDEASFGIRGSQTVLALDSAGRLTGTRIDITVDSAAM